MTRAERRESRRATAEYVRMRAEWDRRWDADRKRYGIAMPQYCKPESFPAGKWELWCAEHPGAINVVAWRQAQGIPEPAPEPAPEPEVGRAEDRQLSWF